MNSKSWWLYILLRPFVQSSPLDLYRCAETGGKRVALGALGSFKCSVFPHCLPLSDPEEKEIQLIRLFVQCRRPVFLRKPTQNKTKHEMEEELDEYIPGFSRNFPQLDYC